MKVYLISIAVVLTFLEISLSDGWSYVRQTKRPVSVSCSALCQQDQQCVKWSQTTKFCLLESVKMQRLRSLYPDLFLSSARNTESFFSEGSIDFSTVSIQRLIGSEPLPLDGSSLLMSSQHFVKGCEYTIATWAWIWRSQSSFEAGTKSAIFR